jgi:hypothetical protein
MASHHQQTPTQLQYQTLPIRRKYHRLQFKLVSNPNSKRKSETMNSHKPPFRMSGRNLFFEYIKETLFFFSSQLEAFSRFGQSLVSVQ